AAGRKRKTNHPLVHVEGVGGSARPHQGDRPDVQSIGGLHVEGSAVTDGWRRKRNGGPRGGASIAGEQVRWGVDLYVLLVGAALRISARHPHSSVGQQQCNRVIKPGKRLSTCR